MFCAVNIPQHLPMVQVREKRRSGRNAALSGAGTGGKRTKLCQPAVARGNPECLQRTDKYLQKASFFSDFFGIREGSAEDLPGLPFQIPEIIQKLRRRSPDIRRKDRRRCPGQAAKKKEIRRTK